MGCFSGCKERPAKSCFKWHKWGKIQPKMTLLANVGNILIFKISLSFWPRVALQSDVLQSEPFLWCACTFDSISQSCPSFYIIPPVAHYGMSTYAALHQLRRKMKRVLGELFWIHQNMLSFYEIPQGTLNFQWSLPTSTCFFNKRPVVSQT